jgi:hypothetical protein
VAAEPLGTIVAWPAETIWAGELFRIVDHAWGQQRAFFVLVDGPQFDTDGPQGGGPYRKAEVWERYLEVVEFGSSSSAAISSQVGAATTPVLRGARKPCIPKQSEDAWQRPEGRNLEMAWGSPEGRASNRGLNQLRASDEKDLGKSFGRDT